MLRVYDRTLQVCLRHRAATMLASLLVLTVLFDVSGDS